MSLDAAILAMESEDWTAAIAALVSLLPGAAGAAGVTVRLLLAQALFSDGQRDEALQQATAARQQAIGLGDRGLIWKSMALIESMGIIDHGRL